MNKLRILFILCLLTVGFDASAYTAKTDHTDVNLWSAPGRETSDKVGKIEKLEEVEVLRSKILPNGQKWLKVQLRRSPGWRRHDQVGWVDSKFFRSISDTSDDDQPSEATATANCKSCLKGAALERPKNLDHITSLSERLAPKSAKGFIWPVTGSIRSGFGMRRHPILGVVKLHNGLDIAGGNGNPVRAAKKGIVISAKGGCKTGRKSCNGGGGNMVVIDHGDGTQTKYLHLNPSCPLPKVGNKVEQGQKIACVGSTGASTGPHLHFSVISKGRYINPLTILPRSK